MASEQQIIDSRRAKCANCGLSGIHVDTTAGEIVQDGDVVAYAMRADRRLMTDFAGSDLICDECADKRIGDLPTDYDGEGNPTPLR